MRVQRALATVSSVALLGGLGLFGGAAAAGGASGGGAAPGAASHSESPVCGAVPTGQARCHVHVSHTGDGVRPDASTSPTGLPPSTIKSVYGFPTGLTAGAGKTIAIVDAYDDPTVFSDFNTFNSQYESGSTGSLSEYKQIVNGTPPASDSGWALEISLDVEWAHAIAPGANILLVEANDNSFTNLMAAEDYASQHATYVSNSWGGSEFCSRFFGCETAYDTHFTATGVSYFVSAGDAGLPAEYPSASPNVISVGGTTLHFDSSGAFSSETGWSSGGGGCSAVETATAAQSHFSQYSQVGCGGKRATPDVSLDADPNSGVSVYDSTPYNGASGWWTVGGTSASSPMWAARSADLGSVVNSTYVYSGTPTFRDVTIGNNGASCLVGYDLCTGRGSWIDAGAADSAPTASISKSCNGTTCNFTASGTDVDSWGSWTGVSSSSSATATQTYSAAGTYPVSVTGTDSDGGEQVIATASVSCSTTKRNRQLSCK